MSRHVYIFSFFLLFIGTACAFAVPLAANPNPVPAASTPEIASPETEPAPTAQNSSLTEATPTPLPTQESLEAIILPIAIYILDDASGEFSSARDAEQLAELYEKVNDIWAQAGIVIEVQAISRVTVEPTHLQAIATRNFRQFFQAIGSDIELPDISLLNAFYAQQIGGPNGITPLGSRAFFVMDRPSVHSERVTSHEIGHILGLHHVRDDPNRLMFSGTNGMALSEEEIAVARYGAQGLLDGVR